MPQAAKTTVVILAMTLGLVLVAAWGWQATTEPFPGRTDPPKCVDQPIATGDKVFPDQVTVSVFNASKRNGLASQTMNALVAAGFGQGDTGNATDQGKVKYAQIWTEDPDSPAVRLVASRLGSKRVEIVEEQGAGVGVTILVGDSFEKLASGKRRVVARSDATICSPPVG